jgi:hypothetical protein
MRAIEFNMLKNSVGHIEGILRQQTTIFYKCFTYNLPIFLTGKIWLLNTGISFSKDVASEKGLTSWQLLCDSPTRLFIAPLCRVR